LLFALVPATAFADGGAGDNQYQDPFSAPPPKKAKKKPATTPAPAPAVTTVPASNTAPASTTSASSQAAPTSSGELPRTGAPADLIGLSGAAFVLAGVALRRRTAPQ
jgi:hypothetical protein